MNLKDSLFNIVFIVIGVIVLAVIGVLIFNWQNGGVQTVELEPGATKCADKVMLYASSGGPGGGMTITSGNMDLAARSSKYGSKLLQAPTGLTYTFTPHVDTTIYRETTSKIETRREYKITYRYCFTAPKTLASGSYDVSAEVTFYTVSTQSSDAVIKIPYKVEIKSKK